jgi:hydrogenase maturation protease
MRTLLVGMGNPILSDDAVGVRLAGALAPHLAGKVDVVEECSVGGLDLLDVLRGYDRAIVLDSLRTSGGTPGDWHRFDASALRETVHLAGVHDANFATALELGRRLGMPLPDPGEIHVFAVEVEDDRTFSERMTPRLERRFPSCAAAILEEVRALLDGGPATAAGTSAARGMLGCS